MEMDMKEILKVLPHRYPFLFIDKVVELEKKKRAVGLKNVTMNEPFFQGHFPGRPIMPGVIIIEAIAQLGGIMILSEYDNKKVIPYLVGIDKLRIRKPVLPGDQLLMETSVISLRGNMGKVKGCAKVNNETVAELEVMFAIVEEEIK